MRMYGNEALLTENLMIFWLIFDPILYSNFINVFIPSNALIL